MPAHAEGYRSGSQQVPVNSFRWFSQPGSIPRGGRRVFLSVWKFLNPYANDPSSSAAQCQAPVVDPKPYDRWGIEDERRAMRQSDLKRYYDWFRGLSTNLVSEIEAREVQHVRAFPRLDGCRRLLKEG